MFIFQFPSSFKRNGGGEDAISSLELLLLSVEVSDHGWTDDSLFAHSLADGFADAFEWGCASEGEFKSDVGVGEGG